MKRILFLLLALIINSPLFAQPATPPGKQIYIPEDLRKMDLDNPESQWAWKRSAETRDVVFFWEKGFGNDLQSPPSLDGRPMSFNLSVLMERVQSFYGFFRDSLQFTLPGSKADRYKMMVMVNYSLDGTAYGGSYDDFIGALWVAPNRIQDKTMNCMAHELGHSFQMQVMADSTGEAWGGTGFFEMTSQWMLWQVNPWWPRDEFYHLEAFRKLTHKAYLAMDNIYHSPYVIQWWSDLHGRTSIGELYRQGKRGEDPVMTYKRMYGMSQASFCEEMLRGYQHLVDFDFKHAQRETRAYACQWETPLDTLKGGWYSPQNALEDYGFCIVPVTNGKRLKVDGKDILYGLVGINNDGTRIYGDLNSSTLPKGTKHPDKLYLVVMGAPKEHQMLRFHHGDSKEAQKNRTYDVRFKL